jgi:hypothetical protein
MGINEPGHWNVLAREVHANAVSKGWWEDNRPWGEIISLCHSEVSEALEEFRNGRRLDEVYASGAGAKPEGIPIELADVVIRVLDYFGKVGEHDLEDLLGSRQSLLLRTLFGQPSEGFPTACADIHDLLSLAYVSRSALRLVDVIIYIRRWFSHHGVDLRETIQTKMAYNRTRPYRHGGKKV